MGETDHVQTQSKEDEGPIQIVEERCVVAIPVGDEEKEGIYQPPENVTAIPTDERPDVFFIHRGPDTKDQVIRPLVYILDESHGVKCFADFHHAAYSIVDGVENVQSFRRGLYTCDFAVMIHSENFHTSAYTMKEYHTMIHREKQEGACLLYPVWLSADTNPSGMFPPQIARRSAIVHPENKSVDEFIIKTALMVSRRLGRRDISSGKINAALRKYRLKNFRWNMRKAKTAGVWIFLSSLILCVIPFAFVAFLRRPEMPPQLSSSTPTPQDTLLVPTAAPHHPVKPPVLSLQPFQSGPSSVLPIFSTTELYSAVDGYLTGGARRAEVNERHGKIEDWDVSRVTSMARLFHAKSIVPTEYGRNPTASGFNADISKWDVRQVTDMSEMFQGAETFNSDLSQWNVSQVVRMDAMFRDATAFNGDLSLWDVKEVTYAEYMFFGAAQFNGDLSTWDVSKVLYTTGMFFNAPKFNSDISKWNMSNVVNTAFMFNNATAFNADISQWDVSRVENMNLMFMDATSFNANISQWNVSGLTKMDSIFHLASSFNADISQWDVSGVTSMNSLFHNAEAFNVDISQWDVSKVDDTTAMFYGAKSFNQNMCAWGSKLPGARTVVFMRDMFVNTACPASVTTPGFPHGPFCHAC